LHHLLADHGIHLDMVMKFFFLIRPTTGGVAPAAVLAPASAA